MTAFTLRFNPGFENDTLEIAVYNAIGAFHAKAVAVVSQDGSGSYTATANVNTTAIGDQLITAELRSDTSGEILNNEDHSLNAAGDAILPPESNAGFNAKLDSIIADGAKEATVNTRATQTSVDALQDRVNHIPSAERALTPGEAVWWSKNQNGGGWVNKDNIYVSIRSVP